MSVRKNGSAHILSTVSSGKNNSANVAYMNEYAVSDYLEIFGYQDQSSDRARPAPAACGARARSSRAAERFSLFPSGTLPRRSPPWAARMCRRM